MITIIARRDFLGFLRDGRLPWVGRLALLLLLSSIVVCWRQHSEATAEREAAQSKGYETWVGQGRKNPHSAAHLGIYVFKPEISLALFDPGLEPYLGATVLLEAHRQHHFKFRPAQDATGLRRFGDLSAAWVLQIIAPLIVVLIGFDSFAGEREKGTLRQLASLGVPACHLLWGKAAAIAAGLGGLLAPAVVLLSAALFCSAGDGELGDSLCRLFWLALGYGLYLGIFVFLALAVSATATSARGALIVLLAIWIGAAIVVPRAASEISYSWLPTPSRFAFDAALFSDLSEAYREALEENFHVRLAQDVPIEEAGRALQIEDHAGYAVFDAHYDALWDIYERQQRAQEWFSLASPLIALRGVSMAMAGTDLAYQRDFSAAAERHRRLIQDLMSDDRIAHGGAEGYNYQADPELWRKVPPFVYSIPRGEWALARCSRNFGMLTIAFILSLLSAVVATRRLRPI
ncbi:MAG: ABC transporter permease [Methylocystaceae bacterium]|nr:MAG: ABC transporter permease [Methylocystaceae bacterium]